MTSTQPGESPSPALVLLRLVVVVVLARFAFSFSLSRCCILSAIAAAAALAKPPLDVDDEGTGGAGTAASPALRIRGTRFCIRCSSTLTRERMSETICIPLDRARIELVEAADAIRRDAGAGVEEARAEGIAGVVLLGTSVRRGDGAGSREGEAVDGEFRFERARLLVRIPFSGGRDRIALRGEEGAGSFDPAKRVVSSVGESRSPGCRSVRGTSSNDSEADNVGDAAVKALSSCGLGCVEGTTAFANWSRRTEASVEASALLGSKHVSQNTPPTRNLLHSSEFVTKTLHVLFHRGLIL